MKCPFCSHDNTRVIDSRPAEENNSIRRRRACDECGKRFTTYEKIETIPLIIIKKDNQVLVSVIANKPREDAVKTACGGGDSNYGYEYEYSYVKTGIIGVGDVNQWHWVHVYAKKSNGSLEELMDSPRNLYFGNGVPIPGFDVNVWPPQESNSSTAVAPKSPPVTIWPNNSPSSNMPIAPMPTWPCQMYCPTSLSARTNNSLRLSNYELNDNKINSPHLNEVGYDEKFMKLISEDIENRYLEIKRIDEVMAEKYLSNVHR